MCFLFLVSKIAFLLSQDAVALEKMDFWKTQKKGTNIFNKKIQKADLRAARDYGIQFVRLVPDKFESSSRDFLIGSADAYAGLISKDLETLKKILDLFHQEKMPVVLSLLSLPGSRWRQHNGDQDDLRLWQDEKYQNQAAVFWRDLASQLKNHPAVLGYNILNEPHLEKLFKPEENARNLANLKKIQQSLSLFYNKVIHSIRLVDSDTPIVLDASSYADPKMFQFLIPHQEKKILYSFHMYEPYAYSNYRMNQKKWKYPGLIQGKYWNKEALKEAMSEVIYFQRRHSINSQQILVGEFGGHRLSPGLDQYFFDLMSIFREMDWHFAFYAFREDTWGGMNYELGEAPRFYHDLEHLKKHKKDFKRYAQSPIWSVIKQFFAP